MKQIHSRIINLADWFNTDPGQRVIQWESSKFDQIVADAFGFNAVQVGLPDWNFLHHNRMRTKIILTDDSFNNCAAYPNTRFVQTQLDALPLASNSIDLLILPHILECADNPHLVLREAERVLVHEGRLIISGFNPWSLWGLRSRMPLRKPWMPVAASRQVSITRLKDWMKLLSFEVDRGYFGCYTPACQTDRWLNRWDFMNQAGDRWWPVAGAVYLLAAVKRTHGMTLIGPSWKGKKKKKFARGEAAISRREVRQLFKEPHG